MQSFRQSKQIARAVQAQIDRAREKSITSQRTAGQNEQLAAGVVASPPVQEHQLSSDPEKEAVVTQEANSAQQPQQQEPGRRSSVQTLESVDSPETSSSGDDDGEAHRVPTAATQYTARAALGHSLTGVHGRDRRTHEGGHTKHPGAPPPPQVFVVGWAGPDDPLNPRNWPVARRVSCTLQISLIAAAVGAASGIDATVLPQAARSLGVAPVAESLATGLYLVGMGVGSLVAGPFSETFGRNAVYVGSLAVFMVWILGAGLAPTLAAQVVFRFLAGCAASTPLVCSGGSVSDMWDGVEKTWAFPLYAIAAFGGPMLGAVMGAYIGPSPLVSWRWAEWTMLLLSGLVVVLVFLLMPETYPPLLLRWKAKHLRRITGDDRFRSEHEIIEATLFSRLRVSMTRPFLMFTEPIILAMTLYLTVVYIVLFTFLVGWPDIFEVTYDISQGLANIIFLAMAIGLQFNFLLIPLVYRLTIKDTKKPDASTTTFNPEMRLYYAMFGPAVCIPVSLFWMGWTAAPAIGIWSPILAAALFGFGVTGVFISAYMYVIDSYEMYSASALTFTALVRYVVAGGMTVAGIPFYDNMGVRYTLTILASISCVLVAVPYALYRWGHLLRKRSKYAVSREL